MPKNPTRLSMRGTRQGSKSVQSSGTGKRTEQAMNTFGRRFSTVTCLGFTVLQFLLCACKAEAGEILIAPQTQHLLLGVDQRATFFCQAVGINAYWSIDGTTVNPNPDEGNRDLIRKGWTFNETRIDDTTSERANIHNMTLQIPSNADFNNTRIQCIGVIHDPATSDPVFLIIKDVYLSLSPQSFLAPSQHYIVLNQSSSFYCDAVGINAYWGINSSTVDDEGRAPWTDMGFTFIKNVTYDPMGNEHIHHNTLRVSISTEYNNTVITCAVVDERHRLVKSNAIKMIVMGAPSSPVPIPIYDSAGVVTLKWDIPFSWSQYPVKTYDVIVPNHPELTRENINKTIVRFSADQHNCNVIEFKVQASSGLGDSKYGSVFGGFPIEPQIMDNSINSIKTSAQENGMPQVSMKIKLPKVCSYQSTNYTVTVVDLEKGSDKPANASPPVITVNKGPFNGTVSSDSIIFTEGLEWRRTYHLTVEFITEVMPQPLMVYKDLRVEPAPLPPTAGPLQDSSQNTQYIIIGSVIGGVLLLIIMIMIAIVAVRIFRRQHMRSWSPSQNGKPPMVTNPIYDGGPVYETIPPGAPLRLHSNSESSNITATSSIPPTPTSPLPPVPLPTESPYAYAPNQVDPAYAQPHQHAHVNFSFEEASYMIMSAVQNETAGKRLSEGEETNLDGDSNSARYVPEPRQPYGSASMV